MRLLITRVHKRKSILTAIYLSLEEPKEAVRDVFSDYFSSATSNATRTWRRIFLCSENDGAYTDLTHKTVCSAYDTLF